MFERQASTFFDHLRTGSYNGHLEASTAVRLARGFRPDAIVLDVMLPDIDGVEVLRRVPPGLFHVLAPSSRKNAGRSAAYPAALARRELAGVLVGPLAYLRSRRRDARLRRASR